MRTVVFTNLRQAGQRNEKLMGILENTALLSGDNTGGSESALLHLSSNGTAVSLVGK